MLAHTPMAGSSRKDCLGRICLTKQGGGAIVAAFLQVVRPAVAVGEAAPELTLNNTMLRQRHRRQCFHKSLSLTQSGQLTQTIGDTTYWMPYGTANQDFWDAGCVRTLTPACYVFLSCESLIPESWVEVQSNEFAAGSLLLPCLQWRAIDLQKRESIALPMRV